MTEAQKEAQKRYENRHTKQYHLKFNTKNDADVIEKLVLVSNTQGYIKSLIRNDLRNGSQDTQN